MNRCLIGCVHGRVFEELVGDVQCPQCVRIGSRTAFVRVF